MAFPDYDYDLYENFEDALGGNWTEVDPDTNIDPQSAAQKYYGSQSCEMDTDGATGGKDIAYIHYNYGSAQSGNVSIGYWFYISSYTDTFHGLRVFANIGEVAGNPFAHIIRLYYNRQGSNPFIYIQGDAASGSVSLAFDTWYWITIKIVKAGTCYLRVYDTSENLVGAEQSCTGKDNDWQYFTLGFTGALDMSDTNVKFYWDDIVIDWTDATFPLLGWETAGGLSIPLLMQQMDHFNGGMLNG